MPCTLIGEYDDSVLERHVPSNTVPKTMTPIGYTLYSLCTEEGCEHPGKTAKNLVLNFEKHEASWRDHGTKYVARPKTDKFQYSGPLDDAPVKKGRFTIYSEEGWTAVDTAAGRTTAGSQGGRTESEGPAEDTGETVIVRS
jgi:hypothetical protein